jgi:hypothetical protein
VVSARDVKGGDGDIGGSQKGVDAKIVPERTYDLAGVVEASGVAAPSTGHVNGGESVAFSPRQPRDCDEGGAQDKVFQMPNI